MSSDLLFFEVMFMTALFFRYQDENTQAFFMVVSCNRWLGIRMDLLCSVFVTIVAVAAISIRENSGK